MEHVWILLTIFAAFLQAVRTAAQRDLNRHLSALVTTYVRSVFGLPVLAAYLLIVLMLTGEGMPDFNGSWLFHTLAGAMTQVVATVFLIMMFRLKSFGVGTMLTKFDIVITAILGAVLFAEAPSGGGLAALSIVVIGVILMSLERTGVLRADAFDARVRQPAVAPLSAVAQLVWDPAIRVAFACAFFFSLSYLTYREATQVIGDGSFVWRGAWTVLLAILMQTVIVGGWLVWHQPGVVGQIRPHWRLSGWIGAMSAVGSICWLTAFALQNASYVRAVGQIEVVFTLLVSWLYYRERITGLEFAGIILTVVGVLMFRLVV